MSFWLNIVLKIVGFLVVMWLINFVLGKILKNDKNIIIERDRVEIYKKSYAKIFFIVSIIFTILIVVIGFLPSNVSGREKHIIATIAIILNACIYLLGFYCYLYIWRIDQNGIYIKNGFFGEKSYPLDQIKSYEISGGNRLIIHFTNGRRRKILQSEDDQWYKELVIEKLNYYSKNMEKPDEKEYIVKNTNKFVYMSIIFSVIAFLLFVLSIKVHAFIGIVFFCAFTVFCVISASQTIKNKIIVNGDNITIYRLFKKTKYIRMSDIKSKKIKIVIANGEETDIYTVSVYGDKKLLLKYNSNDTNARRMEEIMENVPLRE